MKMVAKKVDKEIFEILYQDGLNDTEIATAFNCYGTTIRNWRKKHNLAHNYDPSDYERVFKTNFYCDFGLFVCNHHCRSEESNRRCR